MKRTMMFVSILSALAISAPVFAGQAKVTYEKVEDYTDFEPASGVKQRFQERSMKDLTAHIEELAEQLPEDTTLTITVKDIDLTGRLEPTFGESAQQYIRVVRSVDFPRIEFSYQLTDVDGNELKAGEVNLKDMSFDFNRASSTRMSNDTLYYEQQMLKEWFKKTFSEQMKADSMS